MVPAHLTCAGLPDRRFGSNPVTPYRLEKARRLLASGRSLSQAAGLCGVRADALDLALWRSLGVKQDRGGA